MARGGVGAGIMAGGIAIGVTGKLKRSIPRMNWIDLKPARSNDWAGFALPK
jgi:hypothetical protein